ncbi:ABC transporter substrate-binding protein [Leifsonia aquatica]|uniref:ABC transporter, substrate-binding protein, family 5 n=2 Tax=Leifsonia aquatica TaxID=144185 RepID=U2R4V3_LEIAQ|nr:ABC transporter substrate-binding protein [Leifsonia aquatica]ERK70290.1 ABC transporter, substrate-binding protein, family 5 [Leifsonia aquatica ATCC 14665]MBB2965735.1 peptide/nickel transport system substrate-binding protein [Leifsonia aquatica]
MKKALIAVALAAATALALSACGSGGSDTKSTTGAAGGPLNIGNFADVTSWDPSLADIGFDGPYLSAVYDPLIASDGDGKPVPALATAWKVSDDFKKVTLTLRTGVKFSDGEKFDADAAVKSLDYLKQGARSGEAYENVEKFVAVDPTTVEIDLTQRDDTLLYFMGIGRSYMMAPKAIAAGTLAKEPVGSGPYTLASSSVAGSEYHFTKVANHWDAKQFPFDPLAIYPIQDATARDNAMLSGQINVNYADDTALKQASENSWNVAAKVSGWVGLQFTDRTGSKFKPLGDVKVRQALNYAFDGANILKSVGNGAGKVSNQVFPAGLPGNLTSLDDMYKTSISKAKSLLAEAGYANGFELHMPMSQVFQVWQPVADQVFKDLGITVTWDDMQYMDYQKNAPTYPMFVAFLSMDANPVATVQRQINLPQWYNPTPQVDQFPDVEAAVKKVLTADPSDQEKQIEALNTLVTQKAWYSVWYQANNSYVSTSGIQVTPVVGMMFPTLRQIAVKG